METPLRVPPSPFLKRLGYGTGVSVFEMARSPKPQNKAGTNGASNKQSPLEVAAAARSPWAIKRPCRREDVRGEFGARLLAEAKLLRAMHHPNVVGFRRVVEAEATLAMEKCDASLGALIEERRDGGCAEAFAPAQILRMARDVSAALDYVHATARLLHADVKSHNVLVNGDFAVCKLCDFGVSLPLKENGELEKEAFVGTSCWIAPEGLDMDRPVTTKADIFSFGLTIWEMMSLEIPHMNAGHTLDGTDLSVTVDSSMDGSSILDDSTANLGTRPPVPDVDEDAYTDVLSLFYCMTNDDPAMRPTASHINLFVNDVLKNH